jgi:hypothetical protein
VHERRDGDEAPREQAPDDSRPGFGPMRRVPGDEGCDYKYGARRCRDQEARAEEEIESATLNGEADPCEQRDDRRRKGHYRAQHQPELRQ